MSDISEAAKRGNTALLNAEKIYGSKRASLPQKLTLQASLWAAVGALAWFVLGGVSTVGAWFGQDWEPASALRAYLLIGCAVIYATRLIFTQFYLIKRAMPWAEIGSVAPWIWFVFGVFAFLGGRGSAPASWVTWLGVALYLFGSYLNTGSEFMRGVWKKDPAHKGKLYTEGLFGYSMHINYFGDVVLFTGFALVTGHIGSLAIPLMMAGLFVFVNIPMLDKYLADRYPGQFETYAASTKKLIPWVY